MSRELGRLGEDLVAHWLQTQGWDILARSWHSRWGELDLVAQHPGKPALLAFVEVKTRSQGSWDHQGLLAVTPQKQVKLWKTAQLFLVQHPALADLPCRFDVALIHSQRASSPEAAASQLPTALRLGQFVGLGGYQLRLQTYLASAFEL